MPIVHGFADWTLHRVLVPRARAGPALTASAEVEIHQPVSTPATLALSGETQVMEPVPDHGERSYRGSGRLADKKAVITCADDRARNSLSKHQKLFKGGWFMTFDNSNSEELATKELCTSKMPLASARANSALFILLIVATLFPVSVGRLLGLIFADTDRFAGHVARIVMERPRLLFARLLLVRILVVGHGMLL